MRQVLDRELNQLPQAEVTASQQHPPVSKSIGTLFGIVRARQVRDRRDLLRALLSGFAYVRGPAGELFKRYPVDAATLELDWAPPSSAPRTSQPSDASVPYREVPVAPPKAQVVFWNDPKTTMEFVTRVLREVFAMGETEANYTMLRVHCAGRAVARVADRMEATALVEHATRLARENGMPLRVTLEDL